MTDRGAAVLIGLGAVLAVLAIAWLLRRAVAGIKFPDIATADGRRAWSFLAICGGCMVFTVFAAVGVYQVRHVPGLSFWLALAAHLQVLVGLLALGWTLGRRMRGRVGRDGFEFDDREGPHQ